MGVVSEGEFRLRRGRKIAGCAGSRSPVYQPKAHAIAPPPLGIASRSGPRARARGVHDVHHDVPAQSGASGHAGEEGTGVSAWGKQSADGAGETGSSAGERTRGEGG